MEVTEHHHVKISSMFTALENMDDDANINMAWESTTENIKLEPQSLGYFELKEYKPWFNEGCSR